MFSVFCLEQRHKQDRVSVYRGSRNEIFDDYLPFALYEVSK